MAIADSGLNIGANAMAAAFTHVGLVDGTGAEITGGTYARKPVSWANAVAGKAQLGADQVFAIPAGTTVAGWRAYTALTGGTNHGGYPLPTESFTGAGDYTLLAAQTYFDLDAL